MSNSSLVDYTKLTGNYNPRNNTIKKITIHHCAGNVSVETMGNIFAPASRQASANYGIGSDGRVGMYVEEKNRAWTSSNADNDHQAITIEVANDGGAPDWHVSDTAMAKLIQLCVDICKRNGISKLNYTEDASGNLTRHNMFAATACPGPYLQGKFPYIASEVNKQLSKNTAKAPADSSISYYKLDGTNTGRGENQLIQYTKGNTGTNKYGFEVPIDRNGIAVKNPEYIGNSPVPAGGYVLSGHGKAGEWLHANVREGYQVGIYDGNVKAVKACYKSLNGIDTGRGENQLIAYTKGRTGTNAYGFEVCIVNSVATSDAVYGKGNSSVPAGGYVLSGHGDAGKWLYENVKKGTKVHVDTKFGHVKVG
ncbi:MAG: N-acetylmuramoyl-L-alanine amidase [Clostridiales bacterium]|nr:N-acetylmuramoyl-L-alanine amidase [Clostridiales bacterium]